MLAVSQLTSRVFAVGHSEARPLLLERTANGWVEIAVTGLTPFSDVAFGPDGTGWVVGRTGRIHHRPLTAALIRPWVRPHRPADDDLWALSGFDPQRFPNPMTDSGRWRGRVRTARANPLVRWSRVMGNEHILVVEDHRDARELLVDWLASEGYRVAEATNGAEALALLQKGLRPELVLLDLMMPIMDGWSFMKAAVEAHLLSRSEVWIVSAVDYLVPPMGVRGALPKPVDLDRVLNIVRGVVGMQSLPPTA